MAKIYVGTYAKYNNGSIKGAWIDLAGHDKESFLETCYELHKDESDPELMFQDFEGFPREYYSESSISDELFDYLDLDEDDKEILEAYKQYDQNGTIEEARERYAGTYSDLQDWAYEYVSSCGILDGASETARRYFDYDSFLKDCQLNGEIYSVELGWNKTIVFNVY